MAGYRRNAVGALLRLAGAAILCGAALAGRALFGHAPFAAARDATAYALALVTFAGASAGGALLVMGGRLLAQVEISARWSAGPAGPELSLDSRRRTGHCLIQIRTRRAMIGLVLLPAMRRLLLDFLAALCLAEPV